jgi:hypothetical protein
MKTLPFVLLVSLVVLVGCAKAKPAQLAPLLEPSTTPTITQTATETLAPTLTPPGATLAPRPSATSLPPTTVADTATPTAPIVRPSATPPAAATAALPAASATATRSAGFTRISICLVALSDAGHSGREIGCGDSAILVEREISPTLGPLKAAVEELLSMHDPYYGQSGLYNALYQSQLRVQSVVLDSQGVATIKLTGTLLTGGTCDAPRVIAQFEETGRQFSTVKSVTVLVNGKRLQDLLSEKG